MKKSCMALLSMTAAMTAISTPTLAAEISGLDKPAASENVHVMVEKVADTDNTTSDSMSRSRTSGNPRNDATGTPPSASDTTPRPGTSNNAENDTAADIEWKWANSIDNKKPLFPQLDGNRDGSLTESEFQSGTMLDDETQVFSQLDKDRNGSISESEFNTYANVKGRL